DQVTHLVNYDAGNVIQSRFDYTYDVNGDAKSMTTLDGAWTYTYNADGELVHAVFASTNDDVADQDLVYAYDPARNRVSEKVNGVTTLYAVNARNEDTQIGNSLLTSDGAGNLKSVTTGAAVTNYSYRADNRLSGIVSPTDSFSYTYNALG